jgi:hypothetical protein
MFHGDAVMLTTKAKATRCRGRNPHQNIGRGKKAPYAAPSLLTTMAPMAAVVIRLRDVCFVSV